VLTGVIAASKEPTLEPGMLEQFSREWRSTMQRLRGDVRVVRADLGHTRRMEDEIGRLRQQVHDLEAAKRTEVAQADAVAAKLHEQSHWWLGMYADDGTVMRRAAEYRLEAARLGDEVLHLRSEIRDRARMVTGMSVRPSLFLPHCVCVTQRRQREREMEQRAHRLALSRLAGLAEEIRAGAEAALGLASDVRTDLTCPVCAGMLDRPQHLQPCGHMLCFRCVPVRAAGVLRPGFY
jgi:hypothetical protein